MSHPGEAAAATVDGADEDEGYAFELPEGRDDKMAHNSRHRVVAAPCHDRVKDGDAWVASWNEPAQSVSVEGTTMWTGEYAVDTMATSAVIWQIWTETDG